MAHPRRRAAVPASGPVPGGAPTGPRRWRCFLAVALSDAVRARVAALKSELAGLGAAVRWVRDENLHLTLKFLGPVAEDALPGLRTALRDALAATPPPTAAARGLGVFPTPQRPRVVWAGIDCPPLAEVAAAIDAALAPLGFAAEARPFTAHVTLGRVTDTRRWAPLAAALREHGGDDFGAWTLAEVVAFRSDLRPDGAVYTKLWSIPFGA